MPVLQYHFNWKTLSAMAGDLVEFLFSAVLRRDSQPVGSEFLAHILIVWDGLRSHRSRLAWEFVRRQSGRLWLEFLPAHAPELNPVEYLRAHWEAAFN